MVLTKNLYSRRKGKSSQTILHSNKKLPHKILRTKNGSLRLTLKNGKLTSCGITLQETAINNSILRTHLERYNFNGLLNINTNNKRKRSLNTSDRSQRSNKKIRLNGATINEKLPNLSSKKSSDVNAKSKKYKENIDRDNLRRSVQKEETKSKKYKENVDKDNLRKSVKKEETKSKKYRENDKDNLQKSVQKEETKSKKYRENIDRDNLRKSVQKEETKSKKYSENIGRDNLRKSVQKEEKQSPKIFEKSKFKIRLQASRNKTEKTIKKAPILDKITNSEEKIKKTLKPGVQLIGTGIYYLKFKREKTLSEGRFNYKFQQLVTDVKNMNLPSVAWKIKVIIRQNKISAITFTNKQELERSVTFSLETDHYKLMIDNKRAHLLGSPATIDTPGDIEILLDIIEHIESSSPIILYR